MGKCVREITIHPEAIDSDKTILALSMMGLKHVTKSGLRIKTPIHWTRCQGDDDSLEIKQILRESFASDCKRVGGRV